MYESNGLNWNTLKGPCSVAFAIFLSGGLELLGTRTSILPIKGAWVVATVAVITDMSAPERIIVRAILRAVGSLFGAAVGACIVLSFENMLDLDDGPEDVAAYLFQWFAVTVIAFCCGVACKVWKDYSYSTLLILYTVAHSLYPPNIEDTLQWCSSVCCGAITALITLLIFHFPSAFKAVLELNGQVLCNCLDFVSNSIYDSGDSSVTFEKIKSISRRLATATDAMNHYTRVHKHIPSDRLYITKYRDLSGSLRRVYHSAHNMHLTLDSCDIAGLFLNERFCEVFGFHLLKFKDLLSSLKPVVVEMHSNAKSTAGIERAADYLCDMSECLDSMNRMHALHSTGFLTRDGIRWNVVCMLITLAPVVTALSEYFAVMAGIHEQSDSLTCELQSILKTKARIEVFLRTGVCVSPGIQAN